MAAIGNILDVNHAPLAPPLDENKCKTVQWNAPSYRHLVILQVTRSKDPRVQTEVVARREACRVLADVQLPGCDLYTPCEPCPMCLGAIYWARPARTFYAATAADAADAGFDDAFIYQELKIAPV